MAGLFPLSRYQQLDENGVLLVGARLFLFDGGTTTPRVGYRDSSLTTAHPNPIVADAAGRLPLIYLEDGFYRQRLTTSSGVLVFDDDGIPVVSTTSGGSGTSVDPNATMKTRDIKIRFDDQPIAGYVRLNGRTIGSVASGATERANADTQSLYEELWTFANISVVGGKGATGPADFTANKALTLPDCAGRGIFGTDDMGAGARGILTAATVTGPTLIGSIGGSQQVTIAQANVPIYNLTGGSSADFTVSGTSSFISADHTHTQTGSFASGTESATHTHGVTLGVYGGTGVVAVQGGGTYFVPNNAGAASGVITLGTETANHTHTTTISGQTGGVSANHTHTFSWTGSAPSITISSGGSGTAMSNLPPIMTFMVYIRL